MLENINCVKLKFVRLDLVKNRIDIGLFIPTIKVEAKYDLKGNLLLLPLVGVGDAKLYLSKFEIKRKKVITAIHQINVFFCYCFLENVTTHVQTKIHFPNYMNETVMVATSMKVDFSLTAMRVNLDNLFNGNKVLGK